MAAQAPKLRDVEATPADDTLGHERHALPVRPSRRPVDLIDIAKSVMKRTSKARAVLAR